MPKPTGKKARNLPAVNGTEPEKDYGLINVHRTKKTEEFCILGNAMLRDKRLSFKARGLLSMMLSMPPEWKSYQCWMADQSTDGEHAVRTAVAELIALDYLTREQIREKGKIRGTRWIWRETPERGFPVLDNPAVEKQPLQRIDGMEGLINEGDMRKVKDIPSVPSGDAVVFSPIIKAKWKPDKRTKEQKLATLKLPAEFPSEAEFEAHCEKMDYVFFEYRPDLYLQLCQKKWAEWREDLGKWIPIRDWKAYIAPLNDKILNQHYEP